MYEEDYQNPLYQPLSSPVAAYQDDSKSPSTGTLTSVSVAPAELTPEQLEKKLMGYIVEYTPVKKTSPLHKTDYAWTFLMAVGALWLYYDNVGHDNAKVIATQLIPVLTANFAIPSYAALDFFYDARTPAVPVGLERLQQYFPKQSRKKFFFEVIGALCAALPFGAAALNTGDETGWLKIAKFFVTWIVNGVINTIPMKLILEVDSLRMLLTSPVVLPYLSYREVKPCCFETTDDKIFVKQQKLAKKYKELRQAIQNTMQDNLNKILALSDKELQQTLDKLEGNPKDKFNIVKKLIKSADEEESNSSSETTNLLQVTRPRSFIREKLSAGITTYSPGFLLMVAIIIGVIMEFGDVIYTVDTADDISGGLNLNSGVASAFKTVFSGSAVIPLTILTCYFCRGTLTKTAEFASEVVDSKPMKSFSWRYYAKTKLLLCTAGIYIGYFSSAAGVAMYSNSLTSDDATRWGNKHFGDGWSTLTDLFINITNYGIKFFNTFSLFELIDNALQTFALRCGRDEAKVSVQLTHFWQQLMSALATMSDKALLTAIQSVQSEHRTLFTGMNIDDYRKLRKEIGQLTKEIEELEKSAKEILCCRIFNQPKRAESYHEIGDEPAIIEGAIQNPVIEMSSGSINSLGGSTFTPPTNSYSSVIPR